MFLQHALGILLLTPHYGSAVRDTIPEPEDPSSHHTPFIDQLPEEISLVNSRPSLTNQHPDDRYQPYRAHQEDWPSYFPFVNPNIFNPFENYNQVQDGLFTAIMEQFQAYLEAITQRQNVLMKYVECACPNSENCKKVPELDDDAADLRANNYWNWGFNRPSADVVRADKFYAVMTAFKTAVEKLTLRQNVLYEYVVCSCTATTECSVSIKPVLEVMFTNNPNVTGDIIQNLFVPANVPSPSSFLQTLTSLFSHIPNFGGWFGASVNFNPLSSIFGPSGYFPFNIFKPSGNNPSGEFWSSLSGNKPSGGFWSSLSGNKPGAGFWNSLSGNKPSGEFWSSLSGNKPSGEFWSSLSGNKPSGEFWSSLSGNKPSGGLWSSSSGNKPSGGFWSSLSGIKPSYSAGASYSSSSGPHYSVSIGNTHGKPSHEQYVYNHPSGGSSTSTYSSGGASVSQASSSENGGSPIYSTGAVYSTSSGPHASVSVNSGDGKPGGGQYVYNHPSGGSSTSTYSSGGSTASVASSSDNGGSPSYSSGAIYSSSTGPHASASVSSGDGKPGGEQYVINHPSGGSTHVSTSTDGAGGSSISVVSSSEHSRSARKSVYGPVT